MHLCLNGDGRSCRLALSGLSDNNVMDSDCYYQFLLVKLVCTLVYKLVSSLLVNYSDLLLKI